LNQYITIPGFSQKYAQPYAVPLHHFFIPGRFFDIQRIFPYIHRGQFRGSGRSGGDGMADLELNEKNFDETVKNSPFLVVDLWADWCAPCKMIAPFLDRISEKFKDKMKLAKVNVDDFPSLAERYHVTGIPTLLIFKNGEMAGRLTGAMPEAALETKIAAYF
jgi:thioredoxin 1